MQRNDLKQKMYCATRPTRASQSPIYDEIWRDITDVASWKRWDMDHTLVEVLDLLVPRVKVRNVMDSREQGQKVTPNAQAAWRMNE
jgi:hypothetical protein